MDAGDALEVAADPVEVAAPKAKRKKSTSPTAHTLAECRKRGWIAQVVERPWNKFSKVKLDLFGVIDIVAIAPAIEGQHPRSEHDGDGPCAGCSAPSAIVAIQAAADGRSGASGRGSDHAAHRTKILAEPRAKAWVEAGGRLELWSWGKRGAAGKGKRWTLRVETYAEMVAAARSSS